VCFLLCAPHFLIRGGGRRFQQQFCRISSFIRSPSQFLGSPLQLQTRSIYLCTAGRVFLCPSSVRVSAQSFVLPFVPFSLTASVQYVYVCVPKSASFCFWRGWRRWRCAVKKFLRLTWTLRFLCFGGGRSKQARVVYRRGVGYKPLLSNKGAVLLGPRARLDMLKYARLEMLGYFAIHAEEMPRQRWPHRVDGPSVGTEL